MCGHPLAVQVTTGCPVQIYARFSRRKLQGCPVLFWNLGFALLALVRLEEDVVLDNLGVELAEDGPVVVDEADKVAGDLRELPLTQGQPRGDLKQEKHFN